MKLLDLFLEQVKVPFSEKSTIKIINSFGKEIIVNCEVPTTEEEKMTGLRFRDKLGENSGILYNDIDGGFWMKDVKFNIDMIFISDDDIIVDIKTGKKNDPTSIEPHPDSYSNLEVNYGFAKRNNINIGDRVLRSDGFI